jgi:uncharacterized membrane protein YraQ (UPF0718 family)
MIKFEYYAHFIWYYFAVKVIGTAIIQFLNGLLVNKIYNRRLQSELAFSNKENI